MARAKEGQETTKQSTQQGSAVGGQSGQQSSQTTSKGGGQSGSQQGGSQLSSQQGGGQRQQTGMSRRGQFTPFASPFTLMRMLNEELGRLFAGTAGQGTGLASGDASNLATWAPQVEVFEREGQLVVRADLPGTDIGDVEVDLTDDAIILRGERQEEHEKNLGGIYVSEVRRGSFYREIPLPEGVDSSQAVATFRNGVLEITMPAPQRADAGHRRLEIKDESSSGQKQQQAQSQSRTAGANR